MNGLLETLRYAQVSISMLEVALLAAVLVLAMIFRASRIGVMAAFLFVLRWGWSFIRGHYGSGNLAYQYAYLAVGGIVIVLGVVSMVRQRDVG